MFWSLSKVAVNCDYCFLELFACWTFNCWIFNNEKYLIIKSGHSHLVNPTPPLSVYVRFSWISSSHLSRNPLWMAPRNICQQRSFFDILIIFSHLDSTSVDFLQHNSAKFVEIVSGQNNYYIMSSTVMNHFKLAHELFTQWTDTMELNNLVCFNLYVPTNTLFIIEYLYLYFSIFRVRNNKI